jgi:hypothetical protein
VATGASVIGQNQAAAAQTKAINHQNDVRQHQIDQAATAEINDRLREQRREQGRIAVAAGEAGLSLQSGSVETLLMDSAQQANLANSRSLANRESRKLASAADAQAQIPSHATALGAGIQIASAGAKTYAAAKKGD